MAAEHTALRSNAPDDGGDLYLRLFPASEIGEIGGFLETLRGHEAAFARSWRRHYDERFGMHRELAFETFQAVYLPHLQRAVLRLSKSDVAGFVMFAMLFGQQLADADVPFAVAVAHLGILKDACLSVLALEVGSLDQRVLAMVDKLGACFMTAAADSYYRERREAPANGANGHTAAGRGTRGDAFPAVFEGMVGRSKAMKSVFEHVRRLAVGGAPVLIVGETGTGKELIAHAIHNCGPRRGGPLVAINCAALPRDLIESEVFGYKRGAFSGALNEHPGLFRSAAGGTLLLDEVTEMSPDLQAKLLRVIEERVVRPLGSVAEVPVDVRIVATTNRDPEAAIAAGTLRADLYYRLSAGRIVVPPLRERRDDIVPLVEHHMADLNRRLCEKTQSHRGVASDAMVALLRYRWPGNVRELFNVLENASLECHSQHVRARDLSLPLPAECDASSRLSGEVVTLREGERALIERALLASGGNKLLASRLLGISRKKLYACLAKYAVAASEQAAGDNGSAAAAGASRGR